jgi:hypothetical protein
MHRRPILAWVFALALLSTRAGADDKEPTDSRGLAQQRFRDARQAYQDGRYSAAASLFEAADRLAPHPSTRFNAATAWEQAGETARAATGYDAALSMNLPDEERTEAQQRLSILKKALARVRIQQPLGALITVDHIQRAPVPTVFYLRPGTYTLAIEYRGTNSSSTARVFPGKDHDLKLNLPGSEAPATAPTTRPPFMRPVPPAPPSNSDEGATQKTWGWVGVGASVALSGAAIALGVRALAARDEFVASGKTSRQARSEASDLRLATNLLWGGATVAGATGLVLLLTAPQVEF